MKKTRIIVYIIGATLVGTALIAVMPLWNSWRVEVNGKAELAEARWQREVLQFEAETRHEVFAMQRDLILARERVEKERKSIEAEGIKLFQETIPGSISERYLKWKGIEATLELAQSDNSKVIVIGSGEGGLPIILGGLNQPPTVPVPPALRRQPERRPDPPP